jgi:AAA family ATP:ADP antiporter
MRFTGVPRLSKQFVRAVALFVDFFLIILAYYHIKPASRSLYIQHFGADAFPYAWICAALVLGLLMAPYGRLVARQHRLHVVQGTCLLFMGCLVVFRMLLAKDIPAATFVFYVFVDIFSVVLVEQFWSLANTTFSTRDGKRWYGFVATGGLVGGIVGGAAAAAVLKWAGLGTHDLLLVCAAILGLVLGVNHGLSRLGLYDGTETPVPEAPQADWRVLAANRYLLLIAACLLCAQLCEPIIEFQMQKAVEATYRDLDSRTAFLAAFSIPLGVVSVLVNLLVTPLVLRYVGVIGALLGQPLLVIVTSLFYLGAPSLVSASVMKIADRGLSYSINRAAKELLYIPIDPITTYRAKAWIDMFGYRSFKILGSLVILLATQWLPWRLPAEALSTLSIGFAALWLVTVGYLSSAYRSSLASEPAR